MWLYILISNNIRFAWIISKLLFGIVLWHSWLMYWQSVKKNYSNEGNKLQPPYKFGIVHFCAHICCHPSDIFHVCSNSITVLVCMNILYTVRTQLMCLSLFWHWFNDGKDCCKYKWKLVWNLGERLCSASLHILKRGRNYIE